MKELMCRLGIHKWILCKDLPARFCGRCGLLQHWRLPGMGSWTTVGQLLPKIGNWDKQARDALDALYLAWQQVGAKIVNLN